MLTIGVTGPSGAGKTTLLRAAAERGAMVLDCDEIYHGLLAKCPEMLDEIEVRFPGSVENGRFLDTKKLGKLVYEDPQALADLERITHRYVRQEVEKALAACDAPFAVIDAIALIESGLCKLCDETICVTAPTYARIRRIMKREGVSRDYARSRVRAQKPDRFYISNCSHHIENNYPTAAAFSEAAGALLDQIKGDYTCQN